MRPIPVAFHIWIIEVHTYGIGLALTFWFGLRYTERRLRNHDYPWEWVTGMFLWVVVAAIIGARVASVLPNLSQYRSDPWQVFAIWQGGLSSFGGLIFAIPVGIISSRRRCPEIPTVRLLDLIAPVLMAAWGLGRLLGPQLMVRGGGHPTNAWFGMYYADEVGKRLPVPIFQAMADFAIFGILLLVERWLRSRAPLQLVTVDGGSAEVDGAVGGSGAVGAVGGSGAVGAVGGSGAVGSVGGSGAVGAAGGSGAVGAAGGSGAVGAAGGSGAVGAAGGSGAVGAAGGSGAVGAAGGSGAVGWLPPAGIVIGVGMVLWGIERFFDEHLWLSDPSHLGFILVQVAGIALSVAGLIVLATRIRPFQRWQAGELVGGSSPGSGGSSGEAEGEAEISEVSAGSGGSTPGETEVSAGSGGSTPGESEVSAGSS